jgi:hypothetical protein
MADILRQMLGSIQQEGAFDPRAENQSGHGLTRMNTDHVLAIESCAV